MKHRAQIVQDVLGFIVIASVDHHEPGEVLNRAIAAPGSGLQSIEIPLTILGPATIDDYRRQRIALGEQPDYKPMPPGAHLYKATAEWKRLNPDTIH